MKKNIWLSNLNTNKAKTLRSDRDLIADRYQRGLYPFFKNGKGAMKKVAEQGLALNYEWFNSEDITDEQYIQQLSEFIQEFGVAMKKQDPENQTRFRLAQMLDSLIFQAKALGYKIEAHFIDDSDVMQEMMEEIDQMLKISDFDQYIIKGLDNYISMVDNLNAKLLLQIVKHIQEFGIELLENGIPGSKSVKCAELMLKTNNAKFHKKDFKGVVVSVPLILNKLYQVVGDNEQIKSEIVEITDNCKYLQREVFNE